MRRQDITFAASRVIGGSLEEPHLPLMSDGKTPMAKVYSLGIAIPKENGTPWRETPWGKRMRGFAVSAFPDRHALPQFMWKVIDGDDLMPNARNVAPSSRPGYPGNWVVWFRCRDIPDILNSDGTRELPPSAVSTDKLVMVCADINTSDEPYCPGVSLYLKTVIICREESTT
jgi:hypothetical protein